MRILTDQELDDVFGGQALSNVSTTTMDTVTVNGSSLTSNGGGYWIDISNAGNPYSNEDTGDSGGCYYGQEEYYPAVPNAPTAEKLECILNKVAVPGADLRTDFQFVVFNSYAVQQIATGAVFLSYTEQTYDPTQYRSLNGLTVPANPTQYYPYYGSSSVFAAGMDGTTGTTRVTVFNEAGNEVAVEFSQLSPIEEAIMTAAHEARHQYTSWNPSLLAGRDQETDAITYGYKALMKYRAEGAPGC